MDKSLSAHTIGFVGLGNMGRAMARHLHEAGARAGGWDRRDAPAEAAVALGMQRAATLPELAREIGDGVICVNLTTTDVVEKLVFAQGGLMEGLSSGAMIIDFGTTGVPETKALAQRVAWVDAPVSGGQVGAESGELTIMAGGSDADFARALPILEAVGRRITHLGPSGSGQVTKLANQLIVAQTIDAVAQALRLAGLARVDSAPGGEAVVRGVSGKPLLPTPRRPNVAGGLCP